MSQNTNITHYNRLIRSAHAEQVLSKCKIYVDIDMLRKHNIRRQDSVNSEMYRYLKCASENKSYIHTKYYSRNKTTFRLFTTKGNLNLITLSDPDILSCIKSKYDDGYIVEIDYTSFEYTIMLNLLNIVNAPEDIHLETTNILGCSRDEAKKLNNAILYGSPVSTVISTINKKYDSSSIKKYISLINKIVTPIHEYENDNKDSYLKNGYVVNSYGRKIYPKRVGNIFNNVIQSIGSDIIIEAILRITDFIKNKDANLMFHRFDSLYLDISKDTLYKHLNGINNIMKQIPSPSPRLGTKIKIGKDLTTLEELV